MTISILYFVLSFLAPDSIQPIYSFDSIETPENIEELPMGIDIRSSITISDFKTMLNSVLRSNKHQPLWRSGSFIVWHRGGTTKLISASTNKVRFQSDFYLRYKGLFGVKVTEHKTVVINATATYNNATNKIDISYAAENIRNFPGAFENWFKTNHRRYSKITLPAYVKKIKGGNISVGFKMPKDNQLQVNLRTPLSATALSGLIK